MDIKLEVVVIPVTDVDRAKAFYADGCGFNVDVDDSPSPNFRIVQLTPPGSGCSVTLGKGMAAMEPGTLKRSAPADGATEPDTASRKDG